MKNLERKEAKIRALIDEFYTSRSKLRIAGASNGGLLTGTSITHWPNLFGAALQEAYVGEAPVLLRVETNTGHGTPTSKQIEEIADVLSVFVEKLSIDVGSMLPPRLVHVRVARITGRPGSRRG